MRGRRHDAASERLLLVGSALAALACSDPSPDDSGFAGFADEVVFESAHFRYHAHADDPDACANAVDELERHFEAISSYLGVAAPTTPIGYYKFTSVDELQAARACSLAESPACLHLGRVHSANPLDAHELIHAYLEGARPPWIFVEGLAEALTCGYGPWSRPRDYANFDDVSALVWTDLAAWSPTGEATDLTYYRAGAQLVRYLIDEHGVEQVMRHYGSARASTAPEQVDADFVASFDESLSEAWAAALDLDLPGGPCLTPFECSHRPISLSETWRVEATCGVGYAYGTFELTEPTSLLLAAPAARDNRGERDSLDMLLACDGLTPAPIWTSFFPPRLATRLASGKYALVLPMPERSLQVELGAWSLELGCEAALAQPLTVSDETTLAVPRSERTSYVALNAQQPLTAELQNAGAGSSARLCAGCSDTRECRELDSGPQRLDPGSMSLLEIESAGAAEAFTLVSIRPP
jgi:hypothetical protein